jgi:hypothetical protein
MINQKIYQGIVVANKDDHPWTTLWGSIPFFDDFIR